MIEFTNQTADIGRKITSWTDTFKLILIDVHKVLLVISKRFEEIEEFISKELAEVDQQLGSHENTVFDAELMKRLARDTRKSFHESDPEMYEIGLKSMHIIYDCLSKMIEAVWVFIYHRQNCEKKFLHSMFDGKFKVFKEEIEYLLSYEPANPKRVGRKAQIVTDNILSPANDLPKAGDPRIHFLMTCIRNKYVEYKAIRNSNYKNIQNWLCVLRIGLHMLSE